MNIIDFDGNETKSGKVFVYLCNGSQIGFVVKTYKKKKPPKTNPQTGFLYPQKKFKYTKS